LREARRRRGREKRIARKAHVFTRDQFVYKCRAGLLHGPKPPRRACARTATWPAHAPARAQSLQARAAQAARPAGAAGRRPGGRPPRHPAPRPCPARRTTPPASGPRPRPAAGSPARRARASILFPFFLLGGLDPSGGSQASSARSQRPWTRARSKPGACACAAPALSQPSCHRSAASMKLLAAAGRRARPSWPRRAPPQGWPGGPRPRNEHGAGKHEADARSACAGARPRARAWKVNTRCRTAPSPSGSTRASPSAPPSAGSTSLTVMRRCTTCAE